MAMGGLVSQGDVLFLRTSLASVWWIFALRGVAAIVFGVIGLIWPAQALSMLLIVFAVYVLVDGIAALSSSILGVGGLRLRWWLALAGLLGIGAGGTTFLWPEGAALLVVYLIAGWALVSGTLQVTGAVMLRREIESEWLLILGGVVSVAFGALLFLAPNAGILALAWLVALYALLHGTMLVLFATVLKRHRPSTLWP
jgi:uncharacterized membrane protein HdeD (DUF308 family)